MSFCDWLEQPPTTGRGVTFLAAEDGERVEWSRLYSDALGIAGALQGRGASTVALLGGSDRPVVTAALGCVLSGARLVMLPPFSRAPTAERVESARRLAARLEVSHVLYAEPHAELAAALAAEDAIALSRLEAQPAAAGRARHDPDDAVLLQLTSGTTEHARAVLLTDTCLSAYREAFIGSTGRDPERDVQVSWLPLHYDLGIVTGLLLAAATGTELVLIPTERFVSAPRTWMAACARFGATETLAPSFGYAIAAALGHSGDGLDRMRLTINGGELIEPAAVRRFTDALAGHGLDPGVMACGYGLAEATSGVSVARPGDGLRVDVVDREVLEREGRAVDPAGASAREIASTGPAVVGAQIRIADPQTGAELDPGTVGEIEVAGPTVSPGYAGAPPPGPEHFRDGWLRTGDLGYLRGGELYPCGRLKDLIVAGGRNIAPEEIEHAAGAIAGVRRGNVIAFAVAGEPVERIVVVAEARPDAPAGLRDAVSREIRAEVGLRPDDVVLIAPGALPKTASGKLQRAACRARYLSGELH